MQHTGGAALPIRTARRPPLKTNCTSLLETFIMASTLLAAIHAGPAHTGLQTDIVMAADETTIPGYMPATYPNT